MPDKRLVILDGYSLLFRGFYATRYLSTSDGRPTNALYAFTGMLFFAIEKLQPDAIVVALDAPGKTFRHAEFGEYKGTRKETPNELHVQLDAAREFIGALCIPTLEVTGYEADDVVGTLSKDAEERGYNTLIISGDLDQLQLVDECVSVITNKVGMSDTITYDPAAVEARYGIPPTALPDWKAIVGDTSDNIPGVPGIGEKGATALIQAWGSVENLLENLDKVEPKYQKKIEPVIEQLRQSKMLATIVRDVPLDYDFEPYAISDAQLADAKAFLETYEMKNHARRVGQVLGPYLRGEGLREATPPVQVEEIALEVQLADSPSFEDLSSFVADRPFSILPESGGSAQGSMFEEEGRFAYVAVGQEVRRAPEAVALRLFSERTQQAIVHDAKTLYRRVEPVGQPVLFDATLAGYVLQSGRSSYALRDLVQGYLDLAPPTKPEEMAAALHFLEGAMRERLRKETQESVLTGIEQPLTPILVEMERWGVRVSREFLSEYSKSLQVEIEKIQGLIFELAGQEFNIGSPKQLGEILFEKMGIPGQKKTKTGYATGAEVLQVLAPSYPIAQEIMNWRELTKLKSTYADALPKMIAADGRIHTSFNQAVAATGRLSSNDPNLQNIPIRTEIGRQIRKAFVADPGYQLLSFDYSQIELRVLAHMCGEPALVEAFARHEDVHRATAALMFHVNGPDVTKDQRGKAKLLNFAVLYGVTDFGLAAQLGGEFSVAEARALIVQYNERFPRIKGFMDATIADARAKGFTTTLSGRRRYFPDIHNQNRNERLYAERQAMNAPIQGTAADMIKLAMIRVAPVLRGCASRMLLQVHDELVFELAQGEDGLIPAIRDAMADALPLSVPVGVEAKSGLNWNEMAPLSV